MQPLLEAITERPDDLATWSVYADLLQSQGDPRGELLSLMLRREQAPTQQLFGMQRRFLKRHERTLALSNEVLRRGFITELRIQALDELAKLDEPAMHFVDTVTLEIDGDAWDEWCEALATPRPAIRWLTVEFTSPPEQLALAPLFACCSAVEHVRLKFEEAVELDWSEIAASTLKRLVLVNAGRIEEIPTAPALRELWLLGETEVGDIESFASLERVVITNTVEGANVTLHRPTTSDDPYELEPNAFFLIEGDLDLAIVQKLVARMSGVDHITARIGKLWWNRRPVSVVQMYGHQDGAMLPFGLAIGLHNLTGDHPPIALIETLGEQAQYLVLGEPLTRATIEPGTHCSSLARTAFDLAFGCDPGTAILDDVLDALAVAETHQIVGTISTDQILTTIDPDAEPLRNDEDDYDENENRDPLEQDSEADDEDGYYVAEYETAEEAAYEEPIPLERAIVKTDVHVMFEADAAAEPVDEEAPVVDSDEEEPELDTEEVSERPEQWFEFRDNWELRASDPDDEPGEVRWPDPETVAQAAEDIDTFVAKPECEKHGVVLEACNSCGGPTCEECDKPRIEGTCPACVLEIEKAKPVEQHAHHGRVVD